MIKLMKVLLLCLMIRPIAAFSTGKIITEKIAEGKADSLQNLFYSGINGFVYYLYCTLDNEIWITHNRSEEYRAYNNDGKFLREFSLPHENLNIYHEYISGFDANQTCYLAVIDTTSIRRQRKFRFLKWNYAQRIFERNDLDVRDVDFDGFNVWHDHYAITPMLIPKFQESYFIDTYGDNIFVFDRMGKYLGLISFPFWSSKGYGLSIPAQIDPPGDPKRTYRYCFCSTKNEAGRENINNYIYCTKMGKGKMPILEYSYFNPFTTFADSVFKQFEFIGMDTSGFVYIISMDYGRRQSEAFNFLIIRYNPLERRCDYIIESLQFPNGRYFYNLLKKTVSPQGAILLSFLQPDSETVQKGFRQTDKTQRVGKGESAIYLYIYRIDVPENAWIKKENISSGEYPSDR